MARGYVYLMFNRRNGTLYLGLTNNIARRAYEHRQGLQKGFTKKYGLKALVWYEPSDSIATAIHREKIMKHWPRAESARSRSDEPGVARSLRNTRPKGVDARHKAGHDELQ